MMLSGLRRHAFAGAVGFGGGCCVGLVGWGGAQFIIPGMTHPLMGHTQLAATGISLSSLSLSTITGAVRFLQSDSACVWTAASIALPSIMTARIGTRIAGRISEDALQFAFNGLSLLLIPLHLFVQRRATQLQAPPEGTLRRTLTDHNSISESQAQVANGAVVMPKVEHLAFGCLSGMVSALMGVGGLPLTMSYLTAFTSLPHHLVQGTAVLAVAPSALTSAISRIHVVPPATAAAVAVGAMSGAAVGASVALRTSEQRLRELYMLSLVVLGGRSAVRAGQNLRRMWVARQGLKGQ